MAELLRGSAGGMTLLLAPLVMAFESWEIPRPNTPFYDSKIGMIYPLYNYNTKKAGWGEGAFEFWDIPRPNTPFYDSEIGMIYPL